MENKDYFEGYVQAKEDIVEIIKQQKIFDDEYLSATFSGVDFKKGFELLRNKIIEKLT